ncbi:hypothetical protein ASPVEDRAFT_123659 [Aspergillus versicolor CBS 583.65]|uniref:Aminoglycoside phosphotransferase domain-containing protein n=1 Tax=Aspergillus versicolor CBS 583.65 TaxID=1036611 RepID=A0A1L9PCW0_ASPVE|nr:uncharacterized protein ASPVEDRAFT_123659 [Aspergillus versicolor CBS 583.65]OJI99294.1 hypothetical protein ASPVEDRAFT_123659 [Aspergillus versicolor CBS 583.65]
MDRIHPDEKKCQEHFAVWLQVLSQQLPVLALRLTSQCWPGYAVTEVSNLTTSSSTARCSVTFEDATRVLLWFPFPGGSHMCAEKLSNEVSVMRYLARTTIIPVPTVFGAGTWECGPYIITDFIEGIPLSKRLKPSLPSAKRDLERAYHCISQVMLELSKQTFPRIGALVQSSDGKALAAKIEDLVQADNTPHGPILSKTFANASEYFTDIATQQVRHLRYQCHKGLLENHHLREKYIARCMFRRIARSLETEPGPFRLYCDDLGPSSVFVLSGENVDFSVTAVTNWESTYVAPNEFTYTLPWWLLFQAPQGWEEDLRRFKSRCNPCLDTFLRVLRTCEDREIHKGELEASQCLSNRMADSLDNGLFWFCLAARRTSLLDDIYWTFLDERYFGPLGSLDDRLELLSVDEVQELNRLCGD